MDNKPLLTKIGVISKVKSDLIQISNIPYSLKILIIIYEQWLRRIRDKKSNKSYIKNITN